MLFLLGGGAGDFVPSVFFPKVEAAVVFALAFGFGLAGKVGHKNAQSKKGNVATSKRRNSSDIVATLAATQRNAGR